MNKVFHLGFVIGAFFSLVGLLLLVYSFTGEEIAQNINRWSGAGFIAFGVIMILLSLRKDKTIVE